MGGRVDADRAPLTARPNDPALTLRIALVGVPAAFLVLFYGWPLATLVARVLTPSSLVDAVRRPGVGRVAWFTLWQAVVSTSLTLAAGVGPAFLLSRWDFRGRRALRTLVTVPFLLPTVVVGAAFLSLLPERLHGTATAIVVAHVFFNIAVVVRVVGALWEQLPPDLAAAARVLGAPPSRVWREVTFPLLRPALIAAAVVVFLFTFTSFGTVQVLGGGAIATVEVEVARRALQLGDVGGAAALAVVQLLFLAVVIAAAAWAQRAARIRLPVASVARRRAATARQRVAVALAALMVAAALAAPLVALALSSVRVGGTWTLEAWRELGTTEVRPGLVLGVDPVASIVRSVRVAVAATCVSVVVGALAALAITRRAGTAASSTPRSCCRSRPRPSRSGSACSSRSTARPSTGGVMRGSSRSGTRWWQRRSSSARCSPCCVRGRRSGSTPPRRWVRHLCARGGRPTSDCSGARSSSQPRSRPRSPSVSSVRPPS
jgi:thiamine transport system permease protein